VQNDRHPCRDGAKQKQRRQKGHSDLARVDRYDINASSSGWFVVNS
jgi:hypothetical protein